LLSEALRDRLAQIKEDDAEKQSWEKSSRQIWLNSRLPNPPVWCHRRTRIATESKVVRRNIFKSRTLQRICKADPIYFGGKEKAEM
jgi:hypothetical protein